MFRRRKLIKVVAITTRGCDVRITEWLKILASKDGSDLYLSTGAPPSAKFNGELKPLAKQALPPGMIKKLAYELMNAGPNASLNTDSISG